MAWVAWIAKMGNGIPEGPELKDRNEEADRAKPSKESPLVVYCQSAYLFPFLGLARDRPLTT